MAARLYLRSGELARLGGISPVTLRHYERIEVLPRPQRSAANYRLYPPAALDRLRLIRRALAAGFTLAELARIFKIRDQGGAPCRQVKRLLEQKLERIDEQISELIATRNHLRTTLADWNERLATTPEGAQARLLEALPAGLRPPRKSALKGSTA